MRLIKLIRTHGTTIPKHNDFIINDDALDPEETIRIAVNDYLKTTNVSQFNWDDVIKHIPAHHWQKYGITPLVENNVNVYVDHDEMLI